MRIIFMGTPDFAVPCLNALVDAGHEILCVVAQPDKPKGRGKKLVSPPTLGGSSTRRIEPIGGVRV